MRDLIMWNLITLDGFFEGPKSWDLDWHNEVWGDELQQFSIEQTSAADAILFGRVTYEGMASHWPSARGRVADIMNGISKVVFSSTLERADWNNTRLVREPAEQEVVRLKRQPGKAMLIFGSADLCASLMRNDLIDEYRLCVVPIVLGRGNSLFKPGSESRRMKLLEARPIGTGGTILRYRPA